MENENKDKREQVKGATLRVISVEAQEGSFGEERGKIKKLIISATKEDGTEIRITHKPKEIFETIVDGIKKTRQVMAEVPPEKTRQIGLEIQKKGFCIVKAHYTVWEQWSKELNALKPAVRYVQYENTLNDWEIVREEKVIE